MRWIIALLAMVALGFPGVVSAQIGGGHVDMDAPEISVPDDNINVVKVFFRGGCFSYEWGGDGNFISNEDEDFIWTGQCVAGQPINGSGIFKRITLRGNLKGNWSETSSFYENGIRNGKYTWKTYVAWNSPGQRDFSGSGSTTHGCDDSDDSDWKEYCIEEFAKLTARLKARNAQLGSAVKLSGMRATASATGGDVGQNHGKGGNSDWMYDDADHGKCVSVEAVGSNTGSGLAYGHYRLINRCAYPIKLRNCTNSDRLDGGGNELGASETANAKEWFEYKHLKWDI